MDARELRRKVILARIGVLVVVVLILIACFITSWSGSESGIVSRAEFTLKSDHSEKNMLECLDHAEKFFRAGRKESAQRIEAAVDKSLSAASTDPQTTVKTYLDLAQELKKRGDANYAFVYAFKTLKASQDLFAKEKPKDGVGSLSLLLDAVDTASSIILSSKRVLDAEQVQVALSIADAESAFIRRDAKDRLLDVCIESISKNDLAASDAAVRCFFNKDIILAQRGQLADLEKMQKRTRDFSAKLQDPMVIRPTPQPCLLDHMIEVASAIKNNSMAASKYLGYAEDILTKIDRSKLDDQQKLVLTGCLMRMSRACLDADEKEKALSYARESIFLRPLQDAASGECVNQLLRVLVAEKKFSEAEPVAASAYKFYKANKNNPDILAARGECIAQYFPILVGLQKTRTAVSILNDEIDMQKKLLPASAPAIVDLNCRLADYYLSRNELKAAVQCARKISEISKLMAGDDRLRLNMLLIGYANKTKVQDLAAKASTDAISYINKNRRSNIAPEWIDGLCSALDAIKKSDSEDSYKLALDLIKSGFVQQLSSQTVDPSLLAKVVNTLGTSGEEKDADSLRTEAKDRLPPAKATAFLSQSMDFVVSGEQDSSQYSEPKNAIKVYMDMARSMQGKDDESAFKNAFEAVKIVHVLAGKNPDLPPELLATIEDASAIMASCHKQSPNDDQLKILTELSSLESEYIKTSGKGRILDLTLLAHAKKHTAASDSLFSLMLLRDEILAKKGAAGMLDAQVKETRDALAELHPNGVSVDLNLNFARHLIDCADQLNQHKEALASRRYLAMAKKILEDVSNEQAQQLAAFKAAEAAKTADANKPVDPNNATATTATVQPPAPIDKLKMAEMWNRISSLYAKSGEAQTALLCAKKSVALRGLQDAGSTRSVLNLVDRLIDLGNYAESEQVASDAYKFCKSRTTPEFMTLRVSCARKLLKIERELHKDAIADSIVNEEWAALKDMPPAQAVYANDLYVDLANYFVLHQDSSSAAECISRIQQNTASMKGEQRAAWERSGAQLDLIVLTLHIKNPALTAAAVSELSSYRGLDRASAITTPQKWWTFAMAAFKKSGDQKAYGQVLSLVKDSFKQQLAKPDANPAALGEMLTKLNELGEADTAVSLRTDAQLKLKDAAKDTFLANCKGLPAEVVKPKEEKSASTDDKAQSPNNSGRIDEGD